MVTVRLFVAERDGAAAFALWQAALGATWPLTAMQFRRVIDPTGPAYGRAHFVAEDCSTILGFVATQLLPPNSGAATEGCLPVLLVAPTMWRRGIGTALHDHALAYLREQGTHHVQVGGGSPRIWPGVPHNLPTALPFFQGRGWDFTETSHDLVRDLRDERIALPSPQPTEGITIAVAGAAEIPELLAFERREFPSWLGGYAQIDRLGDHADFLIARRAGGPIIGALILFTPQSHPTRSDVLWTRLLGDDCGGLGAVGVAADARRQGIGAALVARGSAVLRDRGVGQCCIGWTWLLDFYGRLGYRPWRSYAMSWRDG